MPTILALTTADVIAEVGQRLALSLPANAQLVRAYLFATGQEGPTAVKVPVMDNGKTAQYIPWLATAADHPLTNATYLDLEILSDNGERCSFTIFTADQVNPMGNAAVEHPVNSCVGTWLQEGAVWKGNILVMRRGQDGCFVDMRTSDGLRAKSCTIGAAWDLSAGLRSELFII